MQLRGESGRKGRGTGPRGRTARSKGAEVADGALRRGRPRRAGGRSEGAEGRALRRGRREGVGRVSARFQALGVFAARSVHKSHRDTWSAPKGAKAGAEGPEGLGAETKVPARHCAEGRAEGAEGRRRTGRRGPGPEGRRGGGPAPNRAERPGGGRRPPSTVARTAARQEPGPSPLQQRRAPGRLLWAPTPTGCP